MVDIIGRSPISVPVLVLGKLALVGSWLFIPLRIFNVSGILYDSPVTRIAGLALLAGGLAMVITAIIQLGQSAAVGLPERETDLKTHGLYHFSRNPVYLGAFIMCAGSCLYALHPVNILLFATTVAIHVTIIRREEEYLERKFGRAWLEYRDNVPRFI